MSVRNMFGENGGDSGGDDVMPSYTTMQLPTPLLKYGQQGYPHFRYFFLSKSKTSLIWHSDKKKSVPTKIDITTMSRLEKGQQSDIFRKNNASKSHPEHLSFSLYYSIGSTEKSLDVVCKDQMECDIWVRGLLYLIKNKEKIIADAGDLTQDLDHFDGGVKIVNVKNLHQQMHAHLDLCTWGSSQWGQLGHSADSHDVKKEAHPKKVRHLVDHDVDLKFVDCGDSHTVTVSKSGECYAWGNSNSGRLGVVVSGSDGATESDVQRGSAMQHVLLPQVIVGLTGIPIQTVACGAAHTLFVTEDNLLFATGCNISGQLGTGDRIDQITPVSVPLPTAVKVISASAGDQFSAIVATSTVSSGDNTASDISQQHMLYTWGENTYGNLGHGDLERRLVPTRVDSLASSYSVESVSCGAYHTAAIATEIADSESDNDTDRGRRDSVHVDLTGDNELFADESTRGIGSSSKRVVLLTWGWGDCGQLGHGDFTDVTSPKLVDFFQTHNTPIKVSCGTGQTACILESPNEGRMLYLWGAGACVSPEGDAGTPDINTPLCIDTSCLAGVNTSRTSEYDVYTLVQDIACGDLHTLILTGEGLMHVYGKLSPLMDGVSRVENYSENDAKSIASGGSHLAVLLGRKWIKDEDADKCMKCSKEFTFVFRQHHCRSCGGIYCGDCTRKRAPVLKFGYQEMVRVCDTCYTRITNGAVK